MTKDYEISRDTRHRVERVEYEPTHVRSMTPLDDMRAVLTHRVSWGAVLAGVSLALVTHVILNMLGVGVGAAAFNSTDGNAVGYSLGAAIWWAVVGIIAAYVGGFATGRLSGAARPSTAGWHGLTSWAVSVLVLAVVMTTAAGAIIGGPVQDILNMNVVNPAETSAAISTPGEVTAGEVVETAENVAGSVAGGAFFSAIALLLGALAAWWGSRAGAADYTVAYDGRIDTNLH